MPEPQNFEEVLRRLRRAQTGITARDIARSTRIPETEVNRVLLELQRRKLVSFERNRWKAIPALVEAPPPAPSYLGDNSRRPPSVRAPFTEPKAIPNMPRTINRATSRWAGFRALCEYYAECVRLDQKSTVHAKAEEEDIDAVCLRGSLPPNSAFQLAIPAEWSEWAKESTRHQYVFLGYPLHRYLWKERDGDAKATYCSPVFMVPCTFQIDQKRLTVQPLGQVRLNEGWLERRLKNLDERRAFFELCGLSGENDSFAAPTQAAEWTDVAELIQHYYPKWCVERLNPRSLSSGLRLKDLAQDGLYNRAALIFPRSFKYTKRLHEELLELAHRVPDEDLEQSSIRWLFKSNSPIPKGELSKKADALSDANSVKLDRVALPKLNREQSLACQAASRESLSVLVGPPGTGKSRVVQATLCLHAIKGSSALFASRNHQALEAVIPRVNALTEPNSIILRLARPWGAPVDKSFVNSLSKLIAIGADNADGDWPNLLIGLQQQLELAGELSRKIEDITQVKENTAAALEEYNLCRSKVGDPMSLARLDELEGKPIPSLPKSETLQELITGLTKITNGKRGWLWRLGVFLQRFRRRKLLESAQSVDEAFRRLLDPQKRWPPSPKLQDESAATFFRDALTFLLPIGQAVHALDRLAACRAQLGTHAPLEELLREDELLADEIEKQALQLLIAKSRMIGAGLSEDERTRLAEILSAIRNQSGLDDENDSRRLSEAIRKTFPIFLRHFPLVATTNLSVGRDLPLQPGLFDLLVVDEASQCDIASVIPLLFRSRRAMIVGDPMQLPHVTSLSAATDRQLRNQFGVGGFEYERFSYRTVSMFDLAAASDAAKIRTVLRQHHRCHPEIAEYCNQSFYRGDWTVLTEYGGKRGLFWTEAPDDSEPVPGGGVFSANQVELVLAELERLDAVDYDGTIGVVTPFRRQADRTRDRIHAHFKAERLRQWRLLVDTADGFQGDERELVLFSLPGGSGMAEGSMQFLAHGPNRFNVAVSRAKQVLHVFGDSKWAKSCGIPHIENLYRKCEESAAMAENASTGLFREDLVGPVWEPFLANKLRDTGISFVQQYPTCGRFLDFAIFANGKKINIEVDGETWHKTATGERCRADIDRDRVLIAAGWTVIRFWVYQLKENPEGCLTKIKSALR